MDEILNSNSYMRKYLRRCIRVSDEDYIRILCQQYQIYLVHPRWDMFPVGDIHIFKNGQIYCAYSMMGSRVFKSKKEFSYCANFRFVGKYSTSFTGVQYDD